MNAKKLFDPWDEIRKALFQALDQINENQLRFVPCEGLWSLGVVALHIANTEEGWFRYVIGREYDRWPQDYQLEEYPTIAAIKTLLAEVHTKTKTYLEGIEETELDRKIESPWKTHLSIRWIVWHVLEHEIHHRGEIFLMLGLLGMKAPDI